MLPDCLDRVETLSKSRGSRREIIKSEEEEDRQRNNKLPEKERKE